MPIEPSAPGRDEPWARIRRVEDAKTLRALTHPVRIALIESLSVDGPATATEVGERLGETPTTCSFHLRQLAKYGFVEEAGGGKGRARPWRMSSIGLRLVASDDPGTELAAGALARLIRGRQLERFTSWMASRGSYPKQWQDAADDSEFVIYLTPGELRALNDDVLRLMMSRYQERMSDPSTRPPGSAPVEVLVLSYPMRLPEPS